MFQPSAKDIKKRVESLIEKDYLERDAENPTKFIYKPWKEIKYNLNK